MEFLREEAAAEQRRTTVVENHGRPSVAEILSAELRKHGDHADGRTDALNGKGVILNVLRGLGVTPDEAA